MLGRRARAGAAVLAVLVLGSCGAPPATPPAPPPDPSVTLPSWHWTGVDLPSLPGGSLEHVVAGAGSFLASGSAAGPGWERALLLASDDGVTWSNPEVDLAGVRWLTIAAGDGGFVAAGHRMPTPDTAQVVMLSSPDGRAWTEQPVGEPGRLALLGVDWVGDRYLAYGEELHGSERSWFELASSDGVAWTRLDVAAFRRPVATSAGWRMLDASGRWSLPDGTPLDVPRLPSAANAAGPAWPPDGSAVLGGGTLLVASVESRCGLFESCGMVSAAWWAADGEGFAAMEASDPGWPFARATLASAHGLAFAVDDAGSTSVSADGWRWAPLVGEPAPGAGGDGLEGWTSVADVAATADRLVLVGTQDAVAAEGQSVEASPWIAVAAP